MVADGPTACFQVFLDPFDLGGGHLVGDLVALAETAGFDGIHLELTLDVRRTPPRPWAALLNIAGNPLLPTFAEAMRQALTPEETERLTAQLQPQVEQGRGKQRIAIAYLSALRPDDTEHGD